MYKCDKAPYPYPMLLEKTMQPTNKRKTHCNNFTCQSTPTSSDVLVLIHNTHFNTTHIVRIVLWDAQSVCMETTAVTKTSVKKNANIYMVYM